MLPVPVEDPDDPEEATVKVVAPVTVTAVDDTFGVVFNVFWVSPLIVTTSPVESP
jgi:hypothetical protein